jgi:hypothetical protein
MTNESRPTRPGSGSMRVPIKGNSAALAARRAQREQMEQFGRTVTQALGGTQILTSEMIRPIGEMIGAASKLPPMPDLAASFQETTVRALTPANTSLPFTPPYVPVVKALERLERQAENQAREAECRAAESRRRERAMVVLTVICAAAAVAAVVVAVIAVFVH